MSSWHRSHVSARVDAFATAMSDPGSSLAEMALAISMALQPGLDPLDTEVILDELAAAVPSPTRDAVMQYLFVDGTFTAAASDYHHWTNSCLDRVVIEGSGMPITLSIVGIEVARRLGVDLDGVGMPGHFLVGDASDPNWFADPYHAVTGLDRGGARDIFTRQGGRRWLAQYLQPLPDRLVIARVLNNLKATATARRDVARLALVMQLRQELPEFADEYDAAEASLAVFN